MSLEVYNRCQKYNVSAGRQAQCLSDRLGSNQTSELRFCARQSSPRGMSSALGRGPDRHVGDTRIGAATHIMGYAECSGSRVCELCEMGQIETNRERKLVASCWSPRTVPPLILLYAVSMSVAGSNSRIAGSVSMLPGANCM